MKRIEFNPNHKKSAIVSYGTRVTTTGSNVRCVDIEYTREYLMNVLGREQVDLVTEVLPKEKDIEYIASLGMDHIRLGFDQIVFEEAPYVYREEIFSHIDNFISRNFINCSHKHWINAHIFYLL